MVNDSFIHKMKRPPMFNGAKSWRVTDWDTSEKRKQFYRDLEKQRMVLGNETSKDGKKHLQIFISFKWKYSWKAFKKIMGDAHFETALVQNWNYELKEMNYEIEDNRIQGKRTDLVKLKKKLIEGTNMRKVVRDTFNYQAIRMAEKFYQYCEKERPIKKIKVIWIHGKTGCGKTKWVYDNFKPYKPINYKWWNGYDGHKTVLIDEFRRDFCKYHELLKLLDIYPYQVESKGGSRQIQANTFIITSCFHPEEVYETREDIQQLMRRITTIIYFGRRNHPEVQKGNTNFLESNILNYV